MKAILKRLPPFAPDYSGASAVFYPLGGAVILNGADGCIGNVTGYDEPRFFNEPGRVFSSGLREIHAITGDEAVLLEKIREARLTGDIQFILMLGTPTSAVIASDHQSLSRILMDEQQIPVIPLNTTGMETYEIGASKAFEQLAVHWVKPGKKKKGGVNVIGATPLDYWGPEQMTLVRQALEHYQLRINSIWGMDGNGMESIKATLEGDVNLVVSGAGLKAARYLEKEYGMPYVTGVPVGKRSAKRLARKLKNPAGHHMMPLKASLSQMNSPGRSLVIGEQIWANAFREYLEDEGGVSNVDVCSFFQMDKVLMEKDDRLLTTEDDLMELASQNRYTLVVGDPLFQSFFQDEALRFCPVPHLAVSSRLHWDHSLQYTGLFPDALKQGRSLLHLKEASLKKEFRTQEAGK
ncbi:nitrogenase component 1 [Anoxynatronum sibiricum]|uniref:Nitrogenase component 1 n=1 Tax=Anoxynatronum sibiricum TaxID=210623 RepID=A0ABU9VWL0_9CLOT